MAQLLSLVEAEVEVDVDLSTVAQDIVPDADGTRDLGSSTKKFAELYLSGNTIFLGDAQLKSTGEKLQDKDNNNLAVANEEGVAIRIVPLFTVHKWIINCCKFNI